MEIIARLKEETKVRIAPFEAALRAAKGNGADPGDDGLPGKPLTFDRHRAVARSGRRRRASDRAIERDRLLCRHG